jgi:hypothetical protein
VFGCCRFVTDEVRRQMGYSSRAARVRFQGGWLPYYARVRISMPKLFSDPEAIAGDIIRAIGTDFRVGLQLGSRANPVNAFSAVRSADRSDQSQIFRACENEREPA